MEHLLVGVTVVNFPCTVPWGDRASGTTRKKLLGSTVLVGYTLDEDLGLLSTKSCQCTLKQVDLSLIGFRQGTLQDEGGSLGPDSL